MEKTEETTLRQYVKEEIEKELKRRDIGRPTIVVEEDGACDEELNALFFHLFGSKKWKEEYPDVDLEALNEPHGGNVCVVI